MGLITEHRELFKILPRCGVPTTVHLLCTNNDLTSLPELMEGEDYEEVRGECWLHE